MQAPERLDDGFSGPQRQVVRIAQHHLRTGVAKLLDFQSLDTSERADGHERGHVDRPVRRMERRPPRSRAGIGVVEIQ